MLSRVRTTFVSVFLLGASAAPVGAVPPAPPGDSAAAAAESARKGKSRVEVVGERTETATLWANPNGSFTLESSLRPIRVKQDGKWVATDTPAAQPRRLAVAEGHRRADAVLRRRRP